MVEYFEKQIDAQRRIEARAMNSKILPFQQTERRRSLAKTEEYFRDVLLDNVMSERNKERLTQYYIRCQIYYGFYVCPT